MQGGALEQWEGRRTEEWRALWRLPYLQILESTGSTNDVVRALAASGAPAGSLVLAEHQTAGRGRVGRQWEDGAGESLLFSLLLRPNPELGAAPGAAPLRIGLGIARALRRSGIDVRLKWPNDIVHDDRKLAGILCEAATTGGEMTVIAGVGINATQRAEDFPAHLRDSAASLHMVSWRLVERSDVMSAVIDALRPLFSRPLDPLTADELAAFAELDVLAGRAVSLSGAHVAHGIARGIAPDGALLIETDHGIASISSATVRLTPDTSTPQRP